ncbi:MAG: hypothetical protein IPL26_18775 [Leptospiraceae bacterium]|nr:hypothetical protein [Leptospiraceae bacterium]
MSNNRGRIQIQGNKFEDSVSWSSNDPPTAADGYEMLQELENRIPKKEAEIRKNEFESARNFIQKASEKGGVDAPVSKSFKVQESKDIRIDIEVIKGRAFILLVILLIGFIFYLVG